MKPKAEFCDGGIVKLDMRQIEKTKDMVEKAGGGYCKRYRLCMHNSPDNILHEMFICRYKGDYCKPHKHINMPESNIIIEGTEAIIIFDDFGDILDIFILDRDSGYLSYRIDEEAYHMTIPLTEYAIDLEVNPGPFKAGNNIFPIWAPDADDSKAVQEFLDGLMKRIKEKLGGRQQWHI